MPRPWKWTRFDLTENMLKLLAIGYKAHQAGEAETFCGGPGAGHGSSSGRMGLRNRGLTDLDDCITERGIAAFELARREGW